MTWHEALELAARLNAAMPDWHRAMPGALMLDGARVGPNVLVCGQPRIDVRDVLTAESLIILVRMAWPHCRFLFNEYEGCEIYLTVYSPENKRFVFGGAAHQRAAAYITAIESGVQARVDALWRQVPRGA